MRLKKKHSRIVAFAIVILFIVIAASIGAKRGVRGTLPSLELLKNKDGTIDASVVFGEFKKSEIKDGKKLWEVTAKVGKYYPSTGQAELQQAVVTLLKGEDPVILTSEVATVVLDGTELRDVTATGNVVIEAVARNTKIYTDTIAFDKLTDRIHTTSKVKIVSPDMLITGTGLEGNAEVKNFTILNDVETTLQAKSQKKKGDNEKKK